MNMFSQDGTVHVLTQYGNWAWLVAMLLLMGDLLLPLPATLIMAGLGYLYGPIAGGLISVAGSFLSGSAGYWLCRLMGEKTAIKILGQKDFDRGTKISENVGGWVVALSRWLPVFPEVVACMAGLTRMPARKFHGALLCGSLPLGFTYAFVGYTGVEYPGVALALSALLPPLLWWIIRPFFQSRIQQKKMA